MTHTTRQCVSHKPKTKPTHSPTPHVSPNGRVPLRGLTASDEDVRRISRNSMRRNHELGKLLAE